MTLDDAPWHWAHTSNDPLIVADLPPGPHKILIELADANHKVLAKEVVRFEVPRVSAAVPADEKEKANADTDFLKKVMPGIAASVKIAEYAAKNATDEKVREFAAGVAKQHTESSKTASEHAKRLKIVVATDPDGPHAKIYREIASRVRDQLKLKGGGRAAPKIVIEA